MMAKEKPFVHPYIPNSVPEIKGAMLKTIGVEDADTLYQEIPDKLRFKRKLDLPEPFLAEQDLKKHVKSILSKNKTCEENLNFLGGGCWQHYVPAVCDEIVSRSEVLTAYVGEAYTDLGKFQMFFEYQSQLGELVGMEVVCLPIYSWGPAAGNAIRMASRITGRSEVLLPKTVSPERLATIKTLCQPETMPGHIDVKLIGYDARTGLLDLDDLKNQISSKTAAVYIENPSYLGFIETQGKEISEIAHAHGAESIVGVDPISLGVLAAPADYGADIVVGTAQTLGIHMNCGGGMLGFIATRDEEKYVAEYPALMVTITNTVEEGEYGFGWCTRDRTSYSIRDDLGQIRNESKDFTGTSSNLWAIGAAVYMALMGPQGFKEIGELIIQKSHYAMKLLSDIKGVKTLLSPNVFKEFVVNFDETGKSVQEINKALLEHNIFGGKDITKEFPELGNSALYCVTEIHSQNDIQRLAHTLKEVLAK
ncbi:MAG: aminomethyl-transferring glycine dehydrogenase subunit GcvPA [Chloroflexi bacterium]|nr:MAG: aminomethyl-transferring glycine dehydrogenase subunit GcvPA [Chloroflexota bacterium]